MRSLFTVFLFLLACTSLTAQATNIKITNPIVEAILLGDFEPADYPGGAAIDPEVNLASALTTEISPDSLLTYLLEMNVFGNRNTGSDTLSSTFGIGAAQRWAKDRLEGFSERTNNRLQVGYVQFDQEVCGMQRHKNVLAVLPGAGPYAKEVVLVEGHLDSRCADRCDIDCQADGMEDNANGSALVMELARVMSQYRFGRSIAFMLTTGEEQGLVGATAFADYCIDRGVKLYAVQNNDVIGGIICGETASPPGCPGLNDIDSINVRLYSASGTSKNFARYTKWTYENRVAPLLTAPSVINIMSGEDRVGRGGDHIPFRERGFPAIRFTSANEHGNANVADPDYHDRQHTVRDVLGLDTDNDGALDSFFVDVRYLARNTLINGHTLGLISFAPPPPTAIDVERIDFRAAIQITDDLGRDSFLLVVRNVSSLLWDTLIRVAATDTIALDRARFSLSAAYTDAAGVTSLFGPSTSVRIIVSDTDEPVDKEQAVELLQNYPNPFDEATMLRVFVNEPVPYQEAKLVIFDVSGRQLAELPIELKPGLQEVLYSYAAHGYQPGTYTYALVIDGQMISSRQMVYAY